MLSSIEKYRIQKGNALQGLFTYVLVLLRFKKRQQVHFKFVIGLLKGWGQIKATGNPVFLPLLCSHKSKEEANRTAGVCCRAERLAYRC